MENKKTTELMSRKSTLKSKLMAAVSMLLVSAIMVSVTTYAWFILSTAPEVKGMSTTVGSNGALEMALLNKETGIDFTKITTNVGDSSAKQAVTKANETWGNLVDLTDTSYGLSGITMYPARLNWDANGDKTLLSRSKLLTYAQYGTDGRIADLIAADSGVYEEGGFVKDDDAYGVRAIGTAKAQAAEAAALETAKTNYTSFMNGAKNKAVEALNGSAQTIANIAVRHAMTDAGETYTSDEVSVIKAALEKLKAATNDIETALKWAAVAESASKNTIITIDTVDLTNDTNYKLLKPIIADIDAQLQAVGSLENKSAYSWDDISGFVTKLINVDTITIGEGENAKTAKEIKELKANKKLNELYQWSTSMGPSAKLNVSDGLFAKMADFVGAYESRKDTATVTFEFKLSAGAEPIQDTKKATICINKTIQDEAYLIALKTVVDAYKYTPKGEDDNSRPFIGDTYGYAVDLAFRSNAAGELRLSGAASRVSSTNDAAIMGGGCFFTADEGADANALAALRIAFVNSENKVLAVGKLAATATEGSKYAVHLYKFEVANGVLTVTDTQIDNDKLLDLTANEAVALTAVVYMDGDATSFAQGKASGSLNLQFCTSADLTAMSYNNYATAGLTFEGATTAATMGTTTAPIAAPTKILMAGKALTADQVKTVTWAGNNNEVATVEANSGKVTIIKDGKVTITATYRDNSGTHTGSYELVINPASGT